MLKDANDKETEAKVNAIFSKWAKQERGVGFIELIYTGSSNNWDAHDNLKSYEGLATP